MTKPAPVRRCAACRRSASRSEFLKITRQHDTGEIQIGHGMGRSAYLCPTKACIERIRKKNRLQHVLRTPITSDVYQRLIDTIEVAEAGAEDAEGLVIGE